MAGRISSAENPDPFSAAVLTNFSWHWHGEQLVEGGGQRYFVLPFYPGVAHLPGPDADRIWESVQAYREPPRGLVAKKLGPSHVARAFVRPPDLTKSGYS